MFLSGTPDSAPIHRSEHMRQIRARDTIAEVLLRRLPRARELRYRPQLRRGRVAASLSRRQRDASVRGQEPLARTPRTLCLRPRTRHRIRREKLLTTVERGVRARGRLRRICEHKVFEDSAETAATGEEAVRFRNWQSKHPWRTESVAPTALGEFVESRHFL
jgi:G:T-mismatch repair DNA endonuclease (very short patch repair protein)